MTVADDGSCQIFGCARSAADGKMIGGFALCDEHYDKLRAAQTDTHRLLRTAVKTADGTFRLVRLPTKAP